MLTLQILGSQISARRKESRPQPGGSGPQRLYQPGDTRCARERPHRANSAFPKSPGFYRRSVSNCRLREASSRRPTLDELISEEDRLDQGLDRLALRLACSTGPAIAAALFSTCRTPTRTCRLGHHARASAVLGLPFGLPPIFEMNLPEGLRCVSASVLPSLKLPARSMSLDLLAIVGRSQVGRIRYTGRKEQLQEEVPFQSVDEILARRRDGNLFRYLIDQFASFSGISGVQPKVLVRDETASATLDDAKPRLSHSCRGATHIVKFWDANEYPELAANEYFCLEGRPEMRARGAYVPPCRGWHRRWSLTVSICDPNGTYRGFEDFCVLNARRTDEKYRGSYETSVMKRFQDFANSPHVNADLERLFTLIALNCALRNGDAHLKNFGIVYDDVLGEARLAPVFDVVTTTVYVPKDSMALTLNGTTRWPSSRELQSLARRAWETRLRESNRFWDASEVDSETAPEVRN